MPKLTPGGGENVVLGTSGAQLVALMTAALWGSALSYVLHRVVTFRSDPYVRWVEVPAAFVGIAALAALVEREIPIERTDLLGE